MEPVTAVTPAIDAAAVAGRMTLPRAVLFDWDNTLVDTWPCIGRATNITLAAMGMEPWTEAEIRARVAGSLRDTFPRIYGSRWEEARAIYYRAFEAVHLDMLLALPGAEALLRTARDAGLVLGVVSNKTGRYLRREVAHLGWDAYFTSLVGAQDAARDKPAPDPIHRALEGTGIVAGPEVWFVGDAGIDIDCGRAAGCTTLLLHGGSDDAALTPDQRAGDCDALARILVAVCAASR
jgi:phosphoglycolate phosphatase